MSETEMTHEERLEKSLREMEVRPLRMSIVHKLSMGERTGKSADANLRMALDSYRTKAVVGEDKLNAALEELKVEGLPYAERIIRVLAALEIFRPFEMAVLRGHYEQLSFGSRKVDGLLALVEYQSWETKDRYMHLEHWFARLDVLTKADVRFHTAVKVASAEGADSMAEFSENFADRMLEGNTIANSLEENDFAPWIVYLLDAGERGGFMPDALGLVREGLAKEREIRAL